MTPEDHVAQLVERSRDLVSAEGGKEMLHFVEHDEFEMAFEILVLELAEAQVKPPCFDRNEWAQLLIRLGLREESVFVGDLWSVFEDWAGPLDER
jgi:hypothetical protein